MCVLGGFLDPSKGPSTASKKPPVSRQLTSDDVDRNGEQPVPRHHQRRECQEHLPDGVVTHPTRPRSSISLSLTCAAPLASTSGPMVMTSLSSQLRASGDPGQ